MEDDKVEWRTGKKHGKKDAAIGSRRRNVNQMLPMLGGRVAGEWTLKLASKLKYILYMHSGRSFFGLARTA